MKISLFQAQFMSRFNFSSKRADILARFYVKNVSRKEVKKKKNVSTKI